MPPRRSQTLPRCLRRALQAGCSAQRRGPSAPGGDETQRDAPRGSTCRPPRSSPPARSRRSAPAWLRRPPARTASPAAAGSTSPARSVTVYARLPGPPRERSPPLCPRRPAGAHPAPAGIPRRPELPPAGSAPAASGGLEQRSRKAPVAPRRRKTKGGRGAGEAGRAETYARALGKPIDRRISSDEPCLMVPARCCRFRRGMTLLYSSSLAAMACGAGCPRWAITQPSPPAQGHAHAAAPSAPPGAAAGAGPSLLRARPSPAAPLRAHPPPHVRAPRSPRRYRIGGAVTSGRPPRLEPPPGGRGQPRPHAGPPWRGRSGRPPAAGAALGLSEAGRRGAGRLLAQMGGTQAGLKQQKHVRKRLFWGVRNYFGGKALCVVDLTTQERESRGEGGCSARQRWDFGGSICHLTPLCDVVALVVKLDVVRGAKISTSTLCLCILLNPLQAVSWNVHGLRARQLQGRDCPSRCVLL